MTIRHVMLSPLHIIDKTMNFKQFWKLKANYGNVNLCPAKPRNDCCLTVSKVLKQEMAILAIFGGVKIATLFTTNFKMASSLLSNPIPVLHLLACDKICVNIVFG